MEVTELEQRGVIGSSGCGSACSERSRCGPPTVRSFRCRRTSRSVLAALLLRVNRTVRTEDLVDVLWDDDELPSSPRAALQIYVSRLRAALGDTSRTMIRTGDGGYTLHADPTQLDLETFRSLVRGAAEVDDPADKVALVTEGLALWRGEPLAGLDAGALTREMIPRLLEEHLQAQELSFDARLALGDAAAVIPELTELVERHPTRERFWAQLMRAQRASGRPALALSTYGEVSRRLREILGVGPGPEVQRVHAELLAATDTESMVVPRQLPTAAPAFACRTEHASRLNGLLPGAHLGLIIGPAGVGKTSLAIHWAGRSSDTFPDGILYADLLGYSPAIEPADPPAVVPRFLAGWGFRPIGCRSPPTSRSRCTQSARRARGPRRTGQRPDCRSGPTAGGVRAETAAPSSPAGTSWPDWSRPSRLEPIQVDVLDPAQSRQLLAARVGEPRLQEDAESTDALIDRCAGLPLALSLLGAQIALRPRRRPDSFVEMLQRGSRSTRSRPPTGSTYGRSSPGRIGSCGLSSRGCSACWLTIPARRSRGVPRPRWPACQCGRLRMLAVLVANHQVVELGPDRHALHDLLRSLCARAVW